MGEPLEPKQLRAIEFFCGIGGFAVAAAQRFEIALAVDIDRRALEVYAHWFPDHPRRVALIERIAAASLPPADLWWASPPCQPFTSRGRRRDLDDPRTAGLLAFVELAAAVRPRWLAMENVPGFVGSQAHGRLLDALVGAGYHSHEFTLCPSELGWPNRRPRWYLVAGLRPPKPPRPPTGQLRALRGFLDEIDDPSLLLPQTVHQRFAEAMRIVDRDDPSAVAPTFTSGYATSPVQAGGYLATSNGPRRFAPAEVLRLLGFPPHLAFPGGLSREHSWRLAGNSLSIPAVHHCLDLLPDSNNSGDSDRRGA